MEKSIPFCYNGKKRRQSKMAVRVTKYGMRRDAKIIDGIPDPNCALNRFVGSVSLYVDENGNIYENDSMIHHIDGYVNGGIYLLVGDTSMTLFCYLTKGNDGYYYNVGSIQSGSFVPTSSEKVNIPLSSEVIYSLCSFGIYFVSSVDDSNTYYAGFTGDGTIEGFVAKYAILFDMPIFINEERNRLFLGNEEVTSEATPEMFNMLYATAGFYTPSGGGLAPAWGYIVDSSYRVYSIDDITLATPLIDDGKAKKNCVSLQNISSISAYFSSYYVEDSSYKIWSGSFPIVSLVKDGYSIYDYVPDDTPYTNPSLVFKGAVVESESIRVNFHYSGNDYNNEPVDMEDHVDIPLDGETYTGYSMDGQDYQFGDVVSLPLSIDDCHSFVLLKQQEPTLYHIRFLDWDGTTLEELDVNAGNTPSYSGTEPSRDGYRFSGWSPAPYPADKDQDYTAQYVRRYTARFLDWDGEVLSSVLVDAGQRPVYVGETPSREGYRFTGWSPALAPIIADTDYTAQYVKTWNVVFSNWDGSQLKSYAVDEGTTPSYDGETPTREGYRFTGWNPTPYPADKDQEYIAVFELIWDEYAITFADSAGKGIVVRPETNAYVNKITEIWFNDVLDTIMFRYEDDAGTHFVTINYEGLPQVDLSGIIINGTTYNDIATAIPVDLTGDVSVQLVTTNDYRIRFLDWDGKVLQDTYVQSGTMPSYTGETPTRTGYTFSGWTPELAVVTENRDYRAVYTKSVYTIRFLNDTTVLQTSMLTYGAIPVYTGPTPTRTGYVFVGWQPTIYPADKNQDYQARFESAQFSMTFYKCTAENERVDKTGFLQSVGTLSGFFREETSIFKPVVLVEYDKVPDFNYVYISTFGRYYYVTAYTSVRTNLWRLSLSIDTLMSYKDTILSYECYVDRNENEYDTKVEDTLMPMQYQPMVEEGVPTMTEEGMHDFDEGYMIFVSTIYTGDEVMNGTQITNPYATGSNPTHNDSLELGDSNFRFVQFLKVDESVIGHVDIEEVLNTIVEKVIEDDTLASYILSIVVHPLSEYMLPIIGAVNVSDKLLVKNSDSSIQLPTGGRAYYGDTGVIAPTTIAKFEVEPKYDSYLDYSPYSKYEIFLPFHGWEPLDAEDILGKQLIVTYYLKADDTSANASVTTSEGRILLSVQCNVGVSIPINTTNRENVMRQHGANTLNMVMGMFGGFVTGAAGSALGLATGNPAMAIMGGSMGINQGVGALSGALSKNMTTRVSAKGAVGDGNEGNWLSRKVRFRRTYAVPAVDDLDKFAKFAGRPLGKMRTLSTLHGMTIVGGVHVENLPVASDDERNDIERQLRRGVILP